MSEISVPRWFWIVAVLALLWNAVGAMSYLQQVTMTPEALAAMPAAERALHENLPPWVTGAYAIAVWAGLIASVFLLLRRSVATVVFLVSLAAIVVQMFYSFVMSDTLKVYGPQGAILPVLVTLLGVVWVWHARRCQARGWLR